MRLKNKPKAKEIVAESPLFIPDPFRYKGLWKMSFSTDKPIYIEIGCGKGQFIAGMALLYPEAFFIGIERYESVLYHATEKSANLPNVRFLCMDALDIGDVFATGEVDGIFLNFSDPWPKNRHEKRRLTSPRFLDIYHDILSTGSVIEMKTDNVGLFDYSVEQFESDHRFELLQVIRDIYHSKDSAEGNVPTEYEEKFRADGKPICKLIAKVIK